VGSRDTDLANSFLFSEVANIFSAQEYAIVILYIPKFLYCGPGVQEAMRLQKGIAARSLMGPVNKIANADIIGHSDYCRVQESQDWGWGMYIHQLPQVAALRKSGARGSISDQVAFALVRSSIYDI
jgi:hypothetical protein